MCHAIWDDTCVAQAAVKGKPGHAAIACVMCLPQIRAHARSGCLGHAHPNNSGHAETAAQALRHTSKEAVHRTKCCYVRGQRTLVDDHAQRRNVRAQRLDGFARIVCGKTIMPFHLNPEGFCTRSRCRSLPLLSTDANFMVHKVTSI